MTYNILVNQLAIQENGIDISLEAAAVHSVMQSKCGLRAFQKECIKVDGVLFFWFSHSEIKRELPILFPKQPTDNAVRFKVMRIVAELEKSGLIIRGNPDAAKVSKRSYYAFTELSDSLLTSKKNCIKNDTVKAKDCIKNDTVTVLKMIQSKPIDCIKNDTGEYNQSSLESNQREKEKNSPTFEKTETSKQGIKTLDVSTIQKTNTIVPASCLNDTKYRLIETREELIKVTEGIIRENAEGLKMDYERKGFKIQNARDYAIEFATQFFKDAEKCSLPDAKIKDRLCVWSYIFGKVNAEIATATKADNLNLPFAERQAKEAAAVQQSKPTNKNLSSFEQAMAERKRRLFEESKK